MKSGKDDCLRLSAFYRGIFIDKKLLRKACDFDSYIGISNYNADEDENDDIFLLIDWRYQLGYHSLYRDIACGFA
jgi:hypothetical protein